MPGQNGAARLRRFLDSKHYNQRELAAKLEMHWTHANQILSGRRKPGLAVALRIQKLTGIPVDSWSTPEEIVAAEIRRAKNRRKAAKLKRAAAKVTATAPSSPDTSTAMDESAEQQPEVSDERSIDGESTAGQHIPVVDDKGNGQLSTPER